jgi:hypothetical protein
MVAADLVVRLVACGIFRHILRVPFCVEESLA